MGLWGRKEERNNVRGVDRDEALIPKRFVSWIKEGLVSKEIDLIRVASQ